ncbi:hypothetical protein KQI63_12950 [bacterium]|nr:hypothetical protein [bacterium]
MDQQEFWDDYQHLKKEATKLRGSEARLKEIKARYEAISEASLDMMLVVNRVLNIQDVNLVGRNLLNVTRDDIGAHLEDAITAALPNSLIPMLESAFETGRPQMGPWTVQRVNAPALTLTVHVAPVIDDTNNIVGAVIIGRDPSELLSLDERLQEMGNEVERLRERVQSLL